MFQSPLHRGTSSDQAYEDDHSALLEVSIPSSSGHFFRPSSGVTSDVRTRDCFNPLFIGALLQTAMAIRVWSFCSHSFNPLFIGALLQTPTGVEAATTH